MSARTKRTGMRASFNQETHRLVEGLFRVRAVGPFPVRGRREPITAYEVIEAREVVGSPALETLNRTLLTFGQSRFGLRVSRS